MHEWHRQGKTEELGTKKYSSATLFVAYLTRTDLGSNLGIRRESLATKRQSHDKAN
jgi:hypothetical protein